MLDYTGGVAEEVPVTLPVPRPPRPAGINVRTQAGILSSSGAIWAICMRQGLTALEIECLDSIIYSTRTIRQGEALYRANDSFQNIYVIRAGTFKTLVMHRDGLEQVTGFQLAGDVLGLDGVGSGRHRQDATALEDSDVCVIPFYLLESLCRDFKGIQQQIHRLMGSEIVRESEQMMLLGTMSAEQRVATFLVNLSGRMKARGYSAAEFNLRMTREEIGSYLGMQLETVSRTLTKLQQDGLLRRYGKQIRILELDSLGRL